MRELAEAGLVIGESGAAPLAGLRRLLTEPGCSALRDAVRIAADSRVLLIATEGATDPDSYRRATADMQWPRTGERAEPGSDG
jgi:diaminopropionate ammonia-lyase